MYPRCGTALPSTLRPFCAREIRALAAKADPAIESGLRRIAGAAHVPLADERCVVTGLLQILRKEDGAWRHRVDVVDDAMPMGVLARENRRAAGRAQRRRDERVPHLHAALRERVEMWRLNPRMPHVAERVVPQIVHEHEDDVLVAARQASVEAAARLARGDRRFARRPNTSSAATAITCAAFLIAPSRARSNSLHLQRAVLLCFGSAARLRSSSGSSASSYSSTPRLPSSHSVYRHCSVRTL